MTTLLLISSAGGLGSALRFLVDRAAVALLADKLAGLPWATLFINITGSFVLGVVTAATAAGDLSEEMRLVMGVGMCGGYTTFSSAMVDIVVLFVAGRPRWALLYCLATPLTTVAAAAVGWRLG